MASKGDFILRRMVAADCAAVADVIDSSTADLFEREGFDAPPGATGEEERLMEMLLRFLETDSPGAWIAEQDGRVVGNAIALHRDDFWALATLFVAPGIQGAGLGRELINRALEHGRGAGVGMIMSSVDHRALRRYAAAGFALHPAVQIRGSVDRRALPTELSVRRGDADDLELVNDIDRALLGTSRVHDVAFLLEQGAGLLVAEVGGQRGYAVYRDGRPAVDGCPMLLGADSVAAAREVLWAVLAEAREPVWALCWTRRQWWAIEIAFQARLQVSPGGPLFVRGMAAPPESWIPNGLYF